MAGDWIKMRTDLLTSPKVVRMASALQTDRFRIAGGLLSVWSLFDAHSADGVLHGYSMGTVDDLAAWAGFASAMESVGWLCCDSQSLSLPDFDTHNGQSAKRRAQDADRKRSVRNASASVADKKRTRGEERTVENKEQEQKALVQRPAARFADFWSVYPVKKGKSAAEASWKKHGCDAMADRIIDHVDRMKAEDRDWREGYAPHGSTYVNQQGWNDEPKPMKPSASAPSKTLSAIQRLQEKMSGLDNAGNNGRLQQTVVLELGSDASDRHDRGHRDGMD